MADDDAVLRKLKRGENFALARCLFWLANFPAALVLLPGAPAVKYLVGVSVYANIESAYSSLSAKRAERRSLENPPPS